MSYENFDKFLVKTSNDLATRINTPFLENVIHLYYDDYLYMNIKNIATFNKPINFHKWTNGHVYCIVSAIGIREKYYFEFNGGEILFDAGYEDYPFYNGQHRIIERMLHEDMGENATIEVVRMIAEATHILMTPYFVELSRLRFG
jgi:hypothetical protein